MKSANNYLLEVIIQNIYLLRPITQCRAETIVVPTPAISNIVLCSSWFQVPSVLFLCLAFSCCEVGLSLNLKKNILNCFSELFTEKRTERERERESVLKQINLTRASMPHQRVLVYHLLVQYVSYKDLMEDINPFRRLLLLEHIIL